MKVSNEILESEEKEFLTLLASLRNIPAHDPDRFETTDGLDNPDCTNGDRAGMALEALDCFQRACSMTEAVDTAAADLICDLMHLVHADDDPWDVLQSAIRHFLCEAGQIKVPLA